jgi:hypothetical protein
MQRSAAAVPELANGLTPAQAPPAPSSRRPGAFQGAARTLAGEDPPPEQAPAASASAAQQQQGQLGQPANAAEQQQQQAPIVHTIAFYSNGIFTVDDGASPLHSWPP